MNCPFCGSTEVHGPSRLTAAWQGTSGSPIKRQWYLPPGVDSYMACKACHEEFDAEAWFGVSEPNTLVHNAA